MDAVMRHNLAMDAITHAETVVRESARAVNDPNPFERSLSRQYAEHAMAKVRDIANHLAQSAPIEG